MCCNDKGDLFRCASDTCASKWIMSQQIMCNNGSKHIWRNEHITSIVFRSLAPTAPRLHVELIMKRYKLPLITPVVVAALMKFDIQFCSEIYDLQFLSPLLLLRRDHFAVDVIRGKFKVHFSTWKNFHRWKEKFLNNL